MIAHGASPILAARLKGMRPAGLIIVSMIGPVDEVNEVVMTEPDVDYDWAWVVGLPIVIYINGSLNWRKTTLAIKTALPSKLMLWDVDSERGCDVLLKPVIDAGEIRRHGWGWMLDFISWQECDNEDFKKCN